MRKAAFLFSCFLFCALFCAAQQRLLNGYVKDSLTQLPIAGGTLSNPAQKKKAQTDASGFFRLQVSPNDLLYALSPQYNYDTLRYSFLFQDTVTIYLTPVRVLEAVTIEAGYAKYRADSLERRREFEALRGHPLNTVDRSSQKPYFGLTINLDRLFKKKYKGQKRNEENFRYEEERAYVAYRFPPGLVAFYTGLKGDALLAFMNAYTPSYEWLRLHLAKEQLLDYLSEKLVLFRKTQQVQNVKAS